VIHIWLDLPVYLIFSVLTVFYGLSAVAIYLIQFHSPARPLIMTAAGVVAPYFGAVGVLFALLTGFLGAEVAERNRQAARSVLAESSALDTLTTLSRAAGGDGAAIRVAERGYVENVLNKEWELLGSDEASPATSSALRAIFDAVAKPAIASTAGAPLQNSLLNAAVRISTSRAERLALGADRTYELKWACVLLLGLLTQVALALVHIDKPRAMLAAVMLFSIAAILALGLIAEQENPFEPPLEISNAPFVKALANLPAEP